MKSETMNQQNEIVIAIEELELKTAPTSTASFLD